MNAKRPRVALIGAGYWGKNLVRNFHALGALELICDRDESTLEKFRTDYPGVRTCAAFGDVLADDAVDGVVIAAPAEAHFSLAREALLAGKDVLVEKPLALERAQGEELVRIAKKDGRVLMVGHLLQYHPVFVRLKELVREGELGRIDYIYSHRLNLGKIRREENILWSFAPHDISMILALAGEEPDSVQATGGCFLHSRIADVTTTHLKFPSGMGAHIFVSWLHPFKEQKLVVVGEKKMAVFDDTLPWADKLLIYPHSIRWENNMPVPVKGAAERVDVVQDEPLKLECQHFLDRVADRAAPLTDGEEGVRVLGVLNRSQRSLDGGRPRAAGAVVPAGVFAHETAVLDEGVQIGAGTKIWHFSHVLSGSRIGTGCNIGQNVVIGPDVAVGNNCKIQNNVSVYKGVTLEDDVFCGPSMVFTNVHNPRATVRRMDEARPTLVRKGASLGANCTIVCGHTVGRYAFVGAGAVVTHDVPDHTVVAGNPARRIGWMCECGVTLEESLLCPSCGLAYEESGTGLVRRG
ncbi:MAG: Gfo/Idh/MocA family oxidoreductase [Desulfovibrionaceae bacterium]|nr:Gfo/Idh/MocA family oxidoreductase [Desulfovibrionaceae bacterium]